MPDSQVSSEPATVHRRPLRKGARTRQRLLAVASAEFARRGYVRTRVSEVAGKPAVTQPVVYHDFSSKKAMYDEQVEVFATRRRMVIEKARLPDGRPARRLDERIRGS